MSKTGIIYKLVSNDVEIKECYVGSTINFIRRKHAHKNNCNNENGKNYNIYVYQFIRDNNGWDSFSMVQIEEFKFNTRNELNSRERYWIEQLQATLNKNIPTRTDQEYRDQNKYKMTEYYEQNKNKNKYKDKQKEYLLKNKEYNKEYSKEYRLNNKEILNIKKKEYYQKNKDKAKDYYKERYQNKFKFYNEYLEYLQS